MPRRPILAFGLAAILVAGCSDIEAHTAGSAGAGGAEPDPYLPPPPPAKGADASTLPPVMYAIRTWFLGDTDRGGNANLNAWQTFGWNLDGRSFADAKSPGRCKRLPPRDFASLISPDDAPNGVDNAFGRFVSSSIGFEPSFSAATSERATSGSATALLTLDHLGPQADYLGVTGSIVGAIGGVVGADGKPVAPTDAEWETGTYVWRPLAGRFWDTSARIHQGTRRRCLPQDRPSREAM